MRIINYYFFTIICIFLTSCLPKKQFSSVEYLDEDPVQIEVGEPNEEVIRDISNFNLIFFVKKEYDLSSWDRVFIFFKFILKTDPKIIKSGESITAASKNYSYTILKNFSSDKSGYYYRVKCIDKNNGYETEISKFNAKNLARFLATGNLEKSYLVE